MKHFFLTATLALVTGIGNAQGVGDAREDAGKARAAPRKKLLQIGWDSPSTAFVREHWRELDKSPFDGITISLRFEFDGKTWDENGIQIKRAWPRQVLAGALQDLRVAKWTRLTDNFVRVNSTPGELDWWSDADWKAACSNIANIAWLAKSAGLRGIAFDPESYGQKQYRWRPDPQNKARTFAQAKARQRGAQMMRAMAKEFPDLVLWSFWLFSRNLSATTGDDVSQALSIDDYGLLPSFVNGWLDAAPPTVRLIDGEEDAYYFPRDEQFSEIYSALRGVNGPLSQLLAPENRAKYQTQVGISFGVYLDAYLDPPSSPFYLGPTTEGSTRIDRMRTTLGRALSVADDYVWLYNEQVRWWDVPWEPGGANAIVSQKRPGGGRLAEVAVSGITQSVNFARDPRSALRELLASGQAEALPNLAINGDFSQPPAAANEAKGASAIKPTAADWKAEGAPLGWSAWQAEGSKGVFGWDGSTGATKKGAAQLNAAAQGCFIQSFDVKSGERYLIRAQTRFVGARPWAVARWQTGGENSLWTATNADAHLSFDTSGDGARIDGARWRPLMGVVTVPPNAGKLVLLLGETAQEAGHSAWFDDVRVQKLP